MTRALLDFRVDVGGLARYGATLVHALRRLDGELTIATVTLPERAPARWTASPFTPWGRRRVMAMARRLGVDLVHGLHLEIPDVDTARVVTIHDVIPARHPASMPGRLRRRTWHRILASSLAVAHRVIAPSELTAGDLIRLGADPNKIVVVPNGLDSSWFVPSEPEARERARKRFAEGRRYIAAVAGSKAHKNYSVLALAARLLFDHSGVVTVCAGDAPLPRTEWLVSEGWIAEDELLMFYEGAEAFVLPSVIEGFGYPALEAAARGTPVVCGRDIGVRASLGEGAVEVEVDDHEAMARALERLIGDADVRAERSAAAARAAAALTSERMAAGTVEVYREALGEA